MMQIIVFTGTYGHARCLQISEKYFILLSGYFNYDADIKKVFWRLYKDPFPITYKK